MRDALSLFDRMIAYSDTEVTVKLVATHLNIVDIETYFELVDLIIKQQIPLLLVTLDQVLSSGYDGGQFLEGLAAHFRELLVCKDEQTLVLLSASETNKERFQKQSSQLESAPCITDIRSDSRSCINLQKCSQQTPASRVMHDAISFR